MSISRSSLTRWLFAATACIVVATVFASAAQRYTMPVAVKVSGEGSPVQSGSIRPGATLVNRRDSSQRVIGGEIRLCQALGPAAPHPIWGVDSAAGGPCAEVGWDSRGMIPWQEFAQGEYVGHARAPHVPEYRLREGDVVAVYYRRTREELSRPYELEVGDRIRVESLTAGNGTTFVPAETTAAQAVSDDITRELVVQPDGTITLPLLGQVRATRRTVASLRDELEEQYSEFFKKPTITVTPIAVNTKLEDLLQTVDSRAGTLGGIHLVVNVTPSGEIQLPGISSVFVQGLTLAEARQEIDAQYDAAIPGVQITLVLMERARR
ncbi:MAG TPA: polysaccharide biosynthesis/export family protein, partial [Burkholderiaceae bacterium]|nr:polysaccharide biosynthesis/export family protein [Burkholderiaceae bacterium]